MRFFFWYDFLVLWGQFPTVPTVWKNKSRRRKWGRKILGFLQKAFSCRHIYIYGILSLSWVQKCIYRIGYLHIYARTALPEIPNWQIFTKSETSMFPRHVCHSEQPLLFDLVQYSIVTLALVITWSVGDSVVVIGTN